MKTHTDVPIRTVIYEAGGWKLLVQESGKHGANLLLEGRGKGSEWLGEVPYEKVEAFIEFLDKLAEGDDE